MSAFITTADRRALAINHVGFHPTADRDTLAINSVICALRYMKYQEMLKSPKFVDRLCD
jgi:hypothetical protein